MPSGVQQPILVCSVPPEQTPHGVGEQGDDLVPEGADIVAAPHALGDIVLGVEDAMYCDVLVCHIGIQLVLEAVDVNEDPVQLLLVGLELLEPGFALRLPGGEFIGD